MREKVKSGPFSPCDFSCSLFVLMCFALSINQLGKEREREEIVSQD